MTDTRSKPIAVLALNPAVDISYELPQLIADRKVAADRTSYHPGGNGINVARSFTELDIPIRCTSAIGGMTGHRACPRRWRVLLRWRRLIAEPAQGRAGADV
jgi:6-phosphofructokinase 2